MHVQDQRVGRVVEVLQSSYELCLRGMAHQKRVIGPISPLSRIGIHRTRYEDGLSGSSSSDRTDGCLNALRPGPEVNDTRLPMAKTHQAPMSGMS